MLGKRIINTATGAGAACTTDTVQILGDTSCVAYYKMSDATDETGSYDGTPTNVNFNVAGKFGNAGEFNGSSSEIIIPSFFSNPNTNSSTLSLWFKTSINDANLRTIFTARDFATNSYDIFTINGIIRFAHEGNLGGNGIVDGTTTVTDGQWHHMAVVLNNSAGTLNIYLDGSTNADITLTFTSNASLSLFGSQSAFGALPNANIRYFNGSIDQVRIFDRAITANEVTTLYNEVYCQPTIVPTDHFEPVLYTGNGSSQSISTLDFAPDFVWIKCRSDVKEHILCDSVRGVNKELSSDNTYFEESRGVNSFDTNGFTLDGLSANYNGNNESYVSWNWKAGGADVQNTDGTITSQVSANVDAGFSIVSYTTQSSGTATVGHGLSSPPDMIIVKTTGVADSWRTYHSSLGAGYQIYLNLTNSAGATANQWNNTAPTSSVFSLGTDNAGNYASIAYCFHSVDGMSKFGSYVGTGAAGNSIVTGFRPAFVMIKRTSASGSSWAIFDNKRGVGEPSKVLYANLSDSEYSDNLNDIEFLSNGFTLLDNNEHTNYSSNTYIYMAFAEENVEPQPVLANSFNTVTYTGTGTTGGNTLPVTGFGFQPDLVWVKNRDVSVNHYLYDSVRGTGTAKALHSNATSSESTASAYAVNGGVSSFLPDGFTAYRGTDNTYQGTNMNGQDYVAWAWKASNESTINQEGSITSIVSANPAAGFSVVKYQANATQGATIGHGLSSPPEMIITKEFTGTRVWCVYHKDLTSSGYYLELNTSNSELNSLGTAYAGVPNSSTYSVGNSSVTNDPATDSYIAYCFHSVDGYQKVGSYSGNGTDLSITGLGFQPSFLMLKRTDSTSNWVVFDSVRGEDEELYPNLSNAESNEPNRTSLDSDGFTVRSGRYNNSGSTFIYLAIKAN